MYDATGGKAMVDLAFLMKRCPFHIKSGKKINKETAVARRISHQATFLRQSAEWGMRALKGSFPRLKDHIIYFDVVADCKLFLHLIPMIYKFRTKFAGLNQVHSTFYPNFELNGDHVLNIFE